MSFGSTTRNKLQKMVTSCRRILMEEFTSQLQSPYGIQPTGEITGMASMAHLDLDDEHLTVASLLRERIEHLASGISTGKNAAAEAIDRVIREQAFTILNRLAALRMCEERGIVQECIRGGFQSRGFQVYCTTAGPSLGDIYHRYKVYLQCVFDEISVDLGVLFDRFSPFGLLFPREAALLDALLALNDEELKEIWKEDEAIGWIYQYFNLKEEREAMRKASAAPRNSRELAVRNQFFTPRYVVEFLTDNTLGRIWYEMTKGETHLKEECRYLVRRPNEIFLAEGESTPSVDPLENGDRTQEELLREPVYIPHRSMKDPREIRMLDPACGSMHFGLYALDLYERIYEEAWDCHPELMKDLRETCEIRDEFMKMVPELILRHNIHGIEIDPRASQIAGLSLWLRAQRAYQQLGIRSTERPRITRANIVCAEPMPGEKELLDEFLSSFKGQHRIVGELVREVWDKMQLAGEAGSLLKIEEELKGAIERIKNQWEHIQDGASADQLHMWRKERSPRQLEIRNALKLIQQREFWDELEELVLQALMSFAERATDGKSYQRKLFAEDTAQGFAFIDLCRMKYDVVLMNPPFGDASVPSKPYIEEMYGDTKGDVYKTFVECFQDRLVPCGHLGIISSRTGFFLAQSADWRERVVLRLYRPLLLADFGYGVLDAMVETAAYVLRNLSEEEDRQLTLNLLPDLLNVDSDKQGLFSIPKYVKARGGRLRRHQADGELGRLRANGYITEDNTGAYRKFASTTKAARECGTGLPPKLPSLVCLQALREKDKGLALIGMISDLLHCGVYLAHPDSFRLVPNAPFAYWAGNRLLRLFKDLPLFEGYGRTVKQGLATADDFRFVRAWWEAPSEKILTAWNKEIQDEDLVNFRLWCDSQTYQGKCWVYFSKGGEYDPYYAGIHLLVNWERGGREIYASNNIPFGTAGAPMRNPQYYFRPGITWPRRSATLRCAPVPPGCIFSHAGMMAFTPADQLLTTMAVFGSSAFDALIRIRSGSFGGTQFEVGLIQTNPFPRELEENSNLGGLAKSAARIQIFQKSTKETDINFRFPSVLRSLTTSIAEQFETYIEEKQRYVTKLASIQKDIDTLANFTYGISEYESCQLSSALGKHEEPSTDHEDLSELDYVYSSDYPTTIREVVCELLSYFVGCIYGRWNINACAERTQHSELPDPFEALPCCPPGMLKNMDGYPMERSQYSGRLKIFWNGICTADGSHVDNLLSRVRDVLMFISKERASTVEHELCQVLSVSCLDEYFNTPTGFFLDHLKLYSRSHRKAPIYWPLSTESGSYTLWIYYHRLTDQTLFQCVIDFVNPKIESVTQDMEKLRGQVLQGGTAKQRDELEKLQKFQQELTDFRDELLRVAQLPYRPNLNDGVLITASPLFKLFRLPKWRKELEECWKKLAAGEYDWAHLAYSIWPERVRKACKTDKSIAIAHELEELYEEPEAPKKTRKSKKRI